MAGCGKPPAKVEGDYVGYIGGEYSNVKMGLKVGLKRTDSALFGKGDVTYDAVNLMLSQAEIRELHEAMRDNSKRPPTTFTTEFELTGSLNGDSFKLHLKPAAPARFEVKMTGTYSDASKGGPKLGGDAEIWREGKKVDTRSFTLKPVTP